MLIKDEPKGIDLFDSKAHERIADSITEVITSENLNIDIIGLEGAWGSGKSNVIKILEEKHKETHYFFVYDAWGHQEDLQRRSFIEELTDNLINKGILQDEEMWRNNLESLLSHKTKKTNKVTPKLNDKYIYILAILAINFITNRIGYQILRVIIPKSIVDMLKSFITNIYMKEIIIEAVKNVPIILGLGWRIHAYYKKAIEEIDNIEGKKSIRIVIKSFKTTIWNEIVNDLLDLLRIYRKEQLESKIETITSTSEPSVREFKNWMTKVSKSLNKELVVVYDNMDRLESDKAKNLWSSIHTFFSECEYDKTHVIVPFDRKQIRKIFISDNDNNSEADQFINKTFEVVYRVTPPVISDWKNFFHSKFNDLEFDVSDHQFMKVRYIYDAFYDNILPREIIIFLNELCVLSRLWNNEIPIEYIALFISYKNQFLSNPTEEIISNRYMDKVSNIIDGNDVQKYMASLVYNVEPERASQVLLTREIDNSFSNLDIEKFELLSNANDFEEVFESMLNKTDYLENEIEVIYKTLYEKNKSSRIILLLNNIFIKSFLGKELRNIDFENYIAYLIIMNLDKADDILKHYLNVYKENLDMEGTNLYNQITKLEEFLQENDIDFDISDNIPDVFLSLDEFYSFLEKMRYKQDYYNLRTDNEALSKELLQMIDTNKIDELKVDLLEYMPSEIKKMNSVRERLKRKITNELTTSNVVDMYKIIFKIGVEIEDYRWAIGPLSQNLAPNINSNHEFVYIMGAMLISFLSEENFQNSIASNNYSIIVQFLNKTDKELVQGIEKYIRSFCDIGDLINYNLRFNHNLTKEITRYMIVMNEGNNRLVVKTVLEKFDDIVINLNIESEEFAGFIDSWHTYMKKNFENNDFFDIITSKELLEVVFSNDYKMSDVIIDSCLEYFENQDLDYYETLFMDKQESIELEAFYLLMKADRINNPSSKVIVGYKTALSKNVHSGELSSKLKEIFDYLYNYTDKNTLFNLVREIRDEFINSVSILESDLELYLPLLKKYGKLEEQADQSIFKIIAPLLKSDFRNDLLDNFSDELIKISNFANDEVKTLIEILESIGEDNLASIMAEENIEETAEEYEFIETSN